jgi:hypothetical protein
MLVLVDDTDPEELGRVTRVANRRRVGHSETSLGLGSFG